MNRIQNSVELIIPVKFLRRMTSYVISYWHAFEHTESKYEGIFQVEKWIQSINETCKVCWDQFVMKYSSTKNHYNVNVVFILTMNFESPPSLQRFTSGDHWIFTFTRQILIFIIFGWNKSQNTSRSISIWRYLSKTKQSKASILFNSQTWTEHS